jgi:mono/diheme cytochrome c family protein
MIVALFPIGLLIGSVGETLLNGATYSTNVNAASNPGLSASALTATALCSVALNDPNDYVLIWDLWGTPTPTPVRGDAVLTPTPTETPVVIAGDPARGKVLFNSIAGGCYSCHSIGTKGAVSRIAPNLAGIATLAGKKKPGVSAEAYLRSVIVDPNRNIVPKMKPGVMPVTYARTLSAQQIDDLVAYMMTLK